MTDREEKAIWKIGQDFFAPKAIIIDALRESTYEKARQKIISYEFPEVINRARVQTNGCKTFR